MGGGKRASFVCNVTNQTIYIMKVIKFIPAAALMLVCLTGFSRQKPLADARALIQEDRSRAGNLHHHYEPLGCQDTPAPEGYEAFYVSHYGRHGSRYLSNSKELKPVVEALESMKDAGLLTKDGEKLYADVLKLVELHEGMYGMLTQRGSAEHRGIAKRLYARVPEVFGRPERDSVCCVSTPVHRCIQSMANFTLSLKEEAPALKVSFYSGERYRDYLNLSTDDRRSVDEARQFTNGMLESEFNADRLVRKYFTDLQKGKIGRQKPGKFFNTLFKYGSIYQCLDEEDTPDIFAHFTDDELYTLWRIANTRNYGAMCNSVESRGERNPRAALIVADIVEKADEALAKDSHVAAHLRFAHDSGVGPLVSLLALSGNETPLHLDEVCDSWYCFQNICMATNLQIIFYRNKAGNVIVKFIHNEKERTVPALKAVDGGVYYNWKDVRKYCEKLIKENPVPQSL